MSFFNALLKDLLIAGKVAGPVFIHSERGIAVLNASEETAAELVAAHAKGKEPKSNAVSKPGKKK